MIRELLQNYADHFNLEFLVVSGDPNLRHGTGQIVIFWWPLPALWAVIGGQPKTSLFFGHGFWWLAVLLPATVPETTPHALRSLNALLPISILIGGDYFSFSHFAEENQPNSFCWLITGLG
jgi:hypothetical protein